MRNPVYLDGFATMPIAPEAQHLMLEVWRQPSNAGSPHRLGERAAMYVADARLSVADLIGATSSEIFFTSGATEANNIAILGVARWALAGGSARRRIIVSSVEHKAVLAPAETLRSQGFEVFHAPVDGNGVVDCDMLADLATNEVLMISVMLANNETGALQPIDQVAAIARGVGALVHCDAAQAAGKVAIDVLDLDVDYLSLSAHKLYGPGGVGAIYIAANAPRPQPLIFGGGQQGSLRPGTEPVALIAGFGAAAKLALSSLASDAALALELSHRFRRQFWAAELEAELTTGNRQVLPGAMSIYVPGIDAEELIMSSSAEIALSTGSACNSGQVVPSHVLRAMGFSQEKARSVFRIMLNRYISDDDVTYAADKIAQTARLLKDRTGRAHQW
ncbi:cysteine desulfurase family protein [Sinorhizobium medicae]|uniref:cysteine desulfurase family protein n=1 Tax=Sinorhizobium medicae TaxID=110321 RepID=UPI0012954AA6|nr:cysteine desulfurase family protein [Sinorhizobium medicae]MDX0967325.1 aminotransferase class V-fold PLP-dependent enzyme [Sinorhizobium medicae]MQV46305.1 aminotransferase class V-fold PLP-dependent enzyme [Sinorhizobium medicae]MQV54036.1 aminotransferase class V-fold PLP-dependent enzyme [Sinorhizobium medicae]MQV71675.1 aminotransferase class V-fold PLP-dependent enzyme [Sinorhizobium medicae]